MSTTRHMYTRQSCSDLESTEHPGGEIWACEFYTIKVIDDAIGTMLSRKTRLKKVELQQLSKTRHIYTQDNPNWISKALNRWMVERFVHVNSI